MSTWPNIYDAVEIPQDGSKLVLEVEQQLGRDSVRCLAMGTTDGLKRDPTGVCYRRANQSACWAGVVRAQSLMFWAIPSTWVARSQRQISILSTV